jgi:hypothetical protein
MLQVAERHNLIVITDEVYKDFVYGTQQVYSAAMEPAARDRVVRVCSFSKAYGMTGWRVGFLHADAERAAGILKVHDALVTCAPVVSQYAALAALELGAPAIAEFRAEFRRRRDHVIERLDAMPHVFDYQKPNASYFVFPRVKDTVAHARDSRRLAAELLEGGRVAVVPGVAFGPTGEAHLRLCYARAADDIDVAFDRMEDFFAGRPERSTARATSSATARNSARASDVRGMGIRLLRHLARARLARQRPRIVAITGSVGKTLLKRSLHELLSARFRVQANPLSYNTDIGLPLAVLGSEIDTRRATSLAAGFARAFWAAYATPETAEVMVLELGARRPGDIAAHLEIVRPEVLVVTPFVPSYSEEHEQLALLRDEIARLCADRTRYGVRHLLLCNDDPFLAELARHTAGALSFSASDVVASESTTSLMLDGEAIPVARDVVGESGRRALAASVRVARLMDVGGDSIGRFLQAR